MIKPTITIIGAGLAGVEATYQCIKRGYFVRLIEMRPTKSTPAHKTGAFAELVCSNSFRANSVDNAVGLLKEEMRQLDSIIMEIAEHHRVEAGGALAVDRVGFSIAITEVIKKHSLVEVVHEECMTISDGPTIIATGPLTSDSLSNCINDFVGTDELYFYDAVAPILLEESINKNIAYLKSRYDKGEAAYYNCPMNEEEFDLFYETLMSAEVVEPKEYEMKVFEGCMPIEDMAKRGKKTLLFGPLKPVGLKDPRTRKDPYAVVQLRQDDAAKTMYNMVGFQTHLKWGDQKRLIQTIPGLENAEIIRYGVMHRNTYIHSPSTLNAYFQSKKRPDLFFAGQITGVEGYVESAASGMIAGINMVRYLKQKEMIIFPTITAIGSLANYITTPNNYFQPMNVNHGLFEPILGRMKKADRKKAYAARSLTWIEENKEDLRE